MVFFTAAFFAGAAFFAVVFFFGAMFRFCLGQLFDKKIQV